MNGSMCLMFGPRGMHGARAARASAIIGAWFTLCVLSSTGCTDLLGIEIGVPVPLCGDGKLDTSAGEQCDDGGDSAVCDRDCTPVACGDALYNPVAEPCDDGSDSEICNANCTPAVCGDGHVNVAAGEACEEMSATCDYDCTPAVCGDGTFNVLAGEGCDDGNADDRDACVAGCQPARCGDGFAQAGVETCDDGNGDDTDDCVTWCEAASCMDGLLNGGETDLDCGGTCGRACSSGQRCSAAGDCFSGVCSAGVCTTPRLIAGRRHTCVLLEGGDVRCWGYNEYGQLGYGHVDQIGDDEVPSSVGAVPVGGVVVQLAAGRYHTCALLDDGNVRCWGYNWNGQLGYGHTEMIGDDEAPAGVDAVDVGGAVAQLAAGNSHTCALLENGAVRCWGANGAGQLGHGEWNPVGDDEEPSSVAALDLGGRVVQLAAGGDHSCALLEGGAVRCWGYNGEGLLGYGHMNEIGEAPTLAGNVNVGGRVVQLAAGRYHTCALLESGAVRCWGYNWEGQLGLGHTDNIGDDELPSSADVVQVGGRTVQLTAGEEFTCALLEDGAIRCWGYNRSGRLGQGHESNIGDNEMPDSVDAVDVGGHAVEIVAGRAHTCALLEDGALRCWGHNGYGQLGYGNHWIIGDNELPFSVAPVSYR
jgi:alpha-tubulin suppressor-like RCC1 family protein